MSKKKKQKAVRTRDWADKHEDAFSHDRSRYVKAEAATIPPASAARIAPEDVRPNALVIARSGQWAFVRMGDEERLCLLDETLREEESSVLAAGDEVQVESQEEQHVIVGVGPRRTKLSRLAHVHSRLSEQIIAVNIDVLVVVASALRPRFKAGVVDRYLVAAEVGGVKPLLVINKMDLVEAEPPAAQLYRELGLTVLNTNCVDGAGVAALRAALEGKLSVFAGQSGVGKSSLLNMMDPSLDILTREVSDHTEKGRHATTASRLYMIQGGVRIIDTPGVRQLGLWNVSAEGLAFYFPEMAELAGACRFRDCTHIHEPGCAVRQAVDAGEIPRLRYGSYQRIRETLEQGG